MKKELPFILMCIVSVSLLTCLTGGEGVDNLTNEEVRQIEQERIKQREKLEVEYAPKYDRLGATDETVPQSRVPKGPREFESIWFQAWLSSAEGGKNGRECTFQADLCLKDFKMRFRPEMRPKEVK